MMLVIVFFFAISKTLGLLFFFSSRRRHTRWPRDWSSDVCSSDLDPLLRQMEQRHDKKAGHQHAVERPHRGDEVLAAFRREQRLDHRIDRLAANAHVVAASRLVGGGRSPIEALLV